jgi:hypothetical protein
MNRQIGLSKTCRMLAIAGSIAFTAFSLDPAQAQTAEETPQPSPAEPKKTIPEKVAPQEKSIPDPNMQPPASGGTAPGESLSEQLERNEGVIQPRPGTDPEIHVPAPNPDPGTTPVIPPPGSPGNPSDVRPK